MAYLKQMSSSVLKRRSEAAAYAQAAGDSEFWTGCGLYPTLCHRHLGASGDGRTRKKASEWLGPGNPPPEVFGNNEHALLPTSEAISAHWVP